jgi:hypothetical protein
MDVSTVHKRLQKYIREQPINFDVVDFKSTVKQVDESEAFSFQGPKFSLLQSYKLHEISDEKIEKEVDLSS